VKRDEEEKEPQGDFENLDFSRPSFVFKPNEQHDWRQQGIYLVCKSCEIQHAVFIGPDKMLTGFNDKGQPILVSRREYFKK